MDQKLRTERRKLADLKAAEYNPRKALTPDDAEYQKIRRSIEEFGYVDPIIINEDGTIIGGHQRATVLKDLGYQEVDVVVVALDKQREKALNIALNKITGEWDEVKLKDLLLDLDLGDYDISLTGFEQNDLTELVDKLAIEPEAVDDDFNEDEALEQAEAEPVTKLGDVWLLGRHRLMCGDATSAGDVATLMDGKKANLVLTDPPYGVSFKSSDGLSIENDSIKGEEFYQFLLSAFQNMAAHLEKGGAAYIFHADTEGLNFRKAFVDAGFHLSGCCIWVKNSLVLGRSDYQWQHEPVLYGFLQNGKHYWSKNAGRSQTTIWNFDKPKKNKNHPTSKPLDLLAYPIGNSSRENAIVIDTFGGSGSTLMACEKTNRICHTMELDEKYASVILRRFVEDTGDADSVYVIRNGVQIPYADLVKEVGTDE